MKILKLTLIVCLMASCQVEGKGIRRKRRTFDMNYALSELTSTLRDVGDASTPVSDDLNCDQAIDELLLRLPDFGSIFYAIVNGWYIGQWADYSSCLSDAADSQYLLATVIGTYNGQIEFTRGGIGKFTEGQGTRMGLCFPKQCSIDEVRFYTEDLITGYAQGVGWDVERVEYHPASNFDLAQTTTTSKGTMLFGVIIAGAFLFAGLGTLVEMSTIGDNRDIVGMDDKKALHEASKFRRLSQYDSVLLQRKKPWAQKALAFSPIRNVVLESLLPRALRTSISIENQDSNIPKDKHIASNLRVLNGLRAVSMILAAWGMTFYFSWFSIISNKQDVDDMLKTGTFNIVSVSIYTAPLFFFVSGFVQTFAFMQRNSQESMFTPMKLISYYIRKIFRYVPLNIVCLLLLVKMMPYAGNGPVWVNFSKLVAPCDNQWWTNVLWINNLYPASYDDRCLPWTWFVPCYVQLSLTLPIFLYLYNKLEDKVVCGVIFFIIALGSLIANGIFINSKGLGGSIVQNDAFYAEVFSTPLFHFFPFFYGIINSLIYIRYKENRGAKSEFRNSFSSRMIEMIYNNAAPRYLIYLLGFVFMTSSVAWQTPYVGDPTKTQGSVAYATMSFPLFVVGLSFILMPALAGKAEAFRFVFGSQTWTLLSSISIGMYYCVPFIAIFYFMSTQHQITVTYYMFIYYFTGNIVFATVLNHVIVLQVDKPIYALLSLKQDIEDAEKNKDYILSKYLQVFKGGQFIIDDQLDKTLTNTGFEQEQLEKEKKVYFAVDEAPYPGASPKNNERKTASTQRDMTQRGQTQNPLKISDNSQFSYNYTPN